MTHLRSDSVYFVAAAAALILHIVSSSKLGGGASGWLTFGLIFGGWALMLVSFFVGCVSVMNNMSHR
jgi:hypothetical protein